MSTQPRQSQEQEKLRNRAASPAPLWTAVIDEWSEGDGWLLELESPCLYFIVKIQELSVLREAVTFLHTAAHLRLHPRYHAETDQLVLGQFGNASVCLLRDNEDVIRCFLLFGGPEESCTLRVSLDEANINALAESLNEAMASEASSRS